MLPPQPLLFTWPFFCNISLSKNIFFEKIPFFNSSNPITNDSKHWKEAKSNSQYTLH
ncbi:hypothetical protein HDF25_004568 [Pedobacter cryoconitis]|uniref:Uncharacterized protein n=1 Tax=Pedobacter cryoconitis TaxID=188932 RepID=A0A7X0J834_9SPHI|nr:hypothetical protein [Pedobacter cryoconitis]